MLALLVVMILFGRTLMTSAEWHIATVATQGASSAFLGLRQAERLLYNSTRSGSIWYKPGPR
jgi:hypothetical protein